MIIEDIQLQKSEWKRKGWSIPELRGSKQEWFAIVFELVQLIGNSQIADISLIPALRSVSTSYSWRTYAPFLKGVGLVRNHSGVLRLSEAGLHFLASRDKAELAKLIHDNYRLVGEILALLDSEPKTIEAVDKELCQNYCLDWANLNNTRRRMDWLDVLELIQSVGNRKWGLTDAGRKALDTWPLVSPSVIEMAAVENADATIAPPPTVIEDMLSKLKVDPNLHQKRNTYNIWAPSPNKIENLREIVQFAFERVSRSDLFGFIEKRFNVKKSSVESMMPFMKADGLLEEVGRNIYVATAAARAWCETGNDIDFIRILHCHKRFVGEMLVCAENVVTRNEVYAQSILFGINQDKARWIIGFLQEANLLEETQYLHLKTTPLGIKLAYELPLMSPPPSIPSPSESLYDDRTSSKSNSIVDGGTTLFDALHNAARDPMADGKASGVAFEEAIAAMFSYMGFDTKRIGGSGNTDVVVRWKGDDGNLITAIVDGKSKSSGSVSHGDVSDIAIETHKEKNEAEFVAIIGPGFAGETLKNQARKKGFALITDAELIDIARNSQELGLSLSEIATLFKVPNGTQLLSELIATRKREQEIVSLVVTTFLQEQETTGDLCARDLYFLLRRTDISPSVEELLQAFITLSNDTIGVLQQVKKAPAAENTTYAIHNEKSSVNKLRALALAIENGFLC